MSKAKANLKKKPEDEYFQTLAEQSGSDHDQNDSDNDQANQENEDETNKKPIKIKTIVRKPQPKLDPVRLCGQRGLDCLLESFEKFKSKGENNEFKDLNTMISKYEYWTHRLFPKMKFQDVIERLEKLGDKREVKNKMNTLRLGTIENKENEEVDLALEDEAITEQVMTMMKNIETSDDDDDNFEQFIENTRVVSNQKSTEDLEAAENDRQTTRRIEDEDNEDIVVTTTSKKIIEDDESEEVGKTSKPAAKTNVVDDEDEDELFNRLLNENSTIMGLI